jgi:hypothetical protein
MSAETPIAYGPSNMDAASIQETTPQPMEISEQDAEQHVKDSVNPNTPHQAAMRANGVIDVLTENVTTLFSRFSVLVQQDPNSSAANEAYLVYKAAEDKLDHFKKAQTSFLKTTGITPVSSGKDATPSQNTRAAVVPSGLPVLQLKGEHQWRAREEMFDSAHDFCVCFEKVLRAHMQDLNENWERLLPMCMNNEQISWFEVALLGKSCCIHSIVGPQLY